MLVFLAGIAGQLCCEAGVIALHSQPGLAAAPLNEVEGGRGGATK
jgi:hypothetical protein